MTASFLKAEAQLHPDGNPFCPQALGSLAVPEASWVFLLTWRVRPLQFPTPSRHNRFMVKGHPMGKVARSFKALPIVDRIDEGV